MGNKLIVIGSSTGGPKVLGDMFSKLPPLDASIIIVQHIPPLFDKGISERLDELSSMRVKLAEDGETLVRGTAYMAPAKVHLKLVRNSTIALSDEEKVNCCCPSVDVAMRSLEASPLDSIAGVILTGMGFDGTAGIVHIKKLGGMTMAPDEASSVIFGMPKSAIASGNVDHVLSPEHMLEKLVEFVGAPDLISEDRQAWRK